MRPRACAVSSLIALALALGTACGRGAGAPPRPDVHYLVPATASRPSVIELRNLSRADLAVIRAARLDDRRWAELLRVVVAGPPMTDVPTVGRWDVTRDVVRFTPAFRFDPGRAYMATFTPAALPGLSSAPPTMVITNLASLPSGPATRVSALYPSADVVPENLLRVYVQFSGPMARGSGYQYMRILDPTGAALEDPFLPLETELWNSDRTRYTAFFDPGRVKRGILPNAEMGRPVVAGGAYTLEIDARWPDVQGRPLEAVYRKAFRVVAPEDRALAVEAWKIGVPAVRTREPLVVTFDRALDHGLVQRALWVEGADGQIRGGSAAIDPGERSWRFTPAFDWVAGPHQVIVSTILEDPSGNRIGRPFEAALLKAPPMDRAPERVRLPFTIRP